MIILDCEQRSGEWFAARRGIPTASEFKKIITATGKPASSQATYMNTLLFEHFTGSSENDYTNAWMERGTELEPMARSYYEVVNDVEVDEVGLIYRDERKLVSCSPDGLVEYKGGLEIKCPKGNTQFSYYLAGEKVPSDYVPQVQGSLWITGREWWDFLSYHPECERPFLVRAKRDDTYIKKLNDEVEAFVDKMLEKREQLIQKGWASQPTPAAA